MSKSSFQLHSTPFHLLLLYYNYFPSLHIQLFPFILLHYNFIYFPPRTNLLQAVSYHHTFPSVHSLALFLPVSKWVNLNYDYNFLKIEIAIPHFTFGRSLPEEVKKLCWKSHNEEQGIMGLQLVTSFIFKYYKITSLAHMWQNSEQAETLKSSLKNESLNGLKYFKVLVSQPIHGST